MSSLKSIAASVIVLFVLIGCESQPTRGEVASSSSSIQTHRASPADVYVSLGVEYMKLGINDVALQNFKKAIAIDPSSSDAHNVIAVMYERLGEINLAGINYEQAVYLEPANSGAQNNYGRYLCGKGEYKKADQHFLLALKNPLYKSPMNALTNAGICAAKAGDTEKAEYYFRSTLQRNKRFSPALYQMAILRFEQEKYLSVRAYLQRFREVQKHTPATLWLGIKAESKLKDLGAVKSYAMQLQQFHPDSHEAGLLEKSKLVVNTPK